MEILQIFENICKRCSRSGSRGRLFAFDSRRFRSQDLIRHALHGTEQPSPAIP
jgi:hypothetical protein